MASLVRREDQGHPSHWLFRLLGSSAWLLRPSVMWPTVPYPNLPSPQLDFPAFTLLSCQIDSQLSTSQNTLISALFLFLAVSTAWISPSSSFTRANSIYCSKFSLSHSCLIIPGQRQASGLSSFFELLWIFKLSLEHFTCLCVELYLCTMEVFCESCSTAVLRFGPV